MLKGEKNESLSSKIRIKTEEKKKKKKEEFPGSPAFKTLHFNCLPRTRVQSLMRELRSHKPNGTAKKDNLYIQHGTGSPFYIS